MILQSLARYYDRLLATGEVEPPGFQKKVIPWVIELAPDGAPVALHHTERTFTLPAEVKRTVGIAANLLWDNAEYVLGLTRAGATDKQAAKVPERRAAFVEKVAALPTEALADAGVRAVTAFLARRDNAVLEALAGWETLAAEGGNVSFRLQGDDGLVCERPMVAAAIAGVASSGDSVRCLVTGMQGPVAVLHPSIKGVRGAQSVGAALVSFNLEAFTSHGWKQGANAQVSEQAAFAYTAALNKLLARDNKERHMVEGDTTFVFWAQDDTAMEESFGSFFSGYEVATDDQEKPVKKTLGAVRRGLNDAKDDGTPFYVLGLAPNAARLAVRYWYEGTVGELSNQMKKHFDDLAIIGLKQGEEDPLPSLWRLLGTIAIGGDPKSLPDGLRGNLAADIVRAALENTAYPATLLARAVERCRAEQSVPTMRAALIKAVLNRRIRQSDIPAKEITVTLDPENTTTGYLLGRLFAVYEGIQQAANPGINTTIRDRFFGAAGSTPRAAFVELSRLKNAHLKKVRRANERYSRRYENLINEIMGKLDGTEGFPAHLEIDDQGRFVIGYHHQNRDLYTKHDTHEEN
ncbi:type I-C CRISPR-associated protein Cas8c/Csd1 [Magnetospira sp. QH-2]|uniref:type I-C CRISPR-associated protein Cas8c/Csd1 n=1 Tax=Magnetospira sp. (strain QH-2) TaxID=1288970 RepID=UPI0003E81684|nr:type I-C CRISPR-associated protein Cas8c/Csd1 [Magnetospira sp. QH-2]CCQ74034.1 CRISPR-associated protein, Csd1 family [Magnetospira sp. QH-2]